MKIDASAIRMASAHREVVRTEVRETLRAWTGAPQVESEPSAERSTPSVVALSAAAVSAAQATASQSVAVPLESNPAQAIQEVAEATESDPLLYVIKLVVEMLTGVPVKTVSSHDMSDDKASADVPAPGTAPRAGFGLEYQRHELREEFEQLDFQAHGVVRTADGREIRFELGLHMAREFRQVSSQTLRVGEAVRKDPLVINFDGSAAQLQSKRFSFDIDGDGIQDNLPHLAGNRGYLALDLNGNGKIDSGRELFGAQSGDGFAELAHYDADGNGWIDENDPVFADLLVWSPQDGQDALSSAAARGVGALFLGRIDAPFALKDGANAELGLARAAGMYLREDGQAGILQQIDLTV